MSQDGLDGLPDWLDDILNVEKIEEKNRMSNPHKQYQNLFGPDAEFAEHEVGDKVAVSGLAGEYEIVHLAQTPNGLEYVLHDGVDFPFPVKAHQVREINQ